MKNTNIAYAFNRDIAQEVCQTYRHLAGKDYYENNQLKGTVATVAVAPFDDINKWMFLQNYKETGCPLAAIKDYFVPFFDVVLLVKPIVESPLFLIDIRSYLAAIGHPFMTPAMASSYVTVRRQP